jgi:ketosteroid isomerase-like protein
MTADSPASVAAAYFDAWQRKDIERVRPLLHEDVDFVGALGATRGIDQTLAGLGGMFAMTDRPAGAVQTHATDAVPGPGRRVRRGGRVARVRRRGARPGWIGQRRPWGAARRA